MHWLGVSGVKEEIARCRNERRQNWQKGTTQKGPEAALTWSPSGTQNDVGLLLNNILTCPVGPVAVIV